MNTEYCIKCGGKAEFSVSKPKFCPSCGSPFNRVGTPVSKASSRHEEDEEEEMDDEESIGHVDIRALKLKNIFKADVDKNSRITIGDLTPPSSESAKGSRLVPRGEENLSGEELIRKTQMECSRIKSSKTIGE